MEGICDEFAGCGVFARVLLGTPPAIVIERCGASAGGSQISAWINSGVECI